MTKMGDVTPFKVHLVTRWTAVLGILVLCVRRIIFLGMPNFLPSKNWRPESPHARSLGIVANSTAELVVLLTLLGTPFLLFIALRTRRTRAGNSWLVIDFSLAVLLYWAAYLLLPPPNITAG